MTTNEKALAELQKWRTAIETMAGVPLAQLEASLAKIRADGLEPTEIILPWVKFQGVPLKFGNVESITIGAARAKVHGPNLALIKPEGQPS